MPELFLVGNRARLRTWLVFGYALFIAYASLSPFSGWKEQGLDFLAVLQQPLALTYTPFDAALNLLSYLPLGLLLGQTLRVRLSAPASLALATLCGLALSASMEFLQMYLPSRTSSNMDILSNACGVLLGALLAVGMSRWTRLYERIPTALDALFLQGKRMDFGLALLALWMFGQVNPSLPMLGNVFISEVAHPPFAAVAESPFDPWESAAVALNLLMLGVLLLTVLRNRAIVVNVLLLVLASVAALKLAAAAVLLKSSAMLLWMNSEAVLGLLSGGAVLWLARHLAHGHVIRAGTLLTLAYLAVAHDVLDSTPAAAMSVYHWHYGHLLNYNGLAQTITLVFPALLLFHLYRVRHQ